jgi:hypothetical protein
MRLAHTKDGSKILDCYHGNGVIWDKIKAKKQIEVIGIEKERGKGSIALYGECEKVIPRLNLSEYDIIDCDAWGIPYKSINAIFKNKTLKQGTVIFYTFIQASLGRAPDEMFGHTGIKKSMIQKCPTLFMGIAFDSFKEFLRRNGMSCIYDSYYMDGTSRKHYGYFVIGE